MIQFIMRYMLLMPALALAAALSFAHAEACTVCHSKNPAMVRMHEALAFKDCFKCHAPGGLRAKDELPLQRSEDQRCTACHRK